MNTILKISTSSCMPCHRLVPLFTKLSDEYGNKIRFQSVSDNHNYDDFERFARKFNIRAVPVVLAMDENENELERLTGLQSEENYRAFIEKYI